MRATIGVLGAGSWGTALAILANRAGSEVTLWTRNKMVQEIIERERINEVYLPDCFIDPEIKVTLDLNDICASEKLIIAIPAQSLRTLCISLSDVIEPTIPLIIACKGIERGSLALMSEVVESILPANPIAILSGPNFAGEAAKGMPTATTLACRDQVIAEKICHAIGSKFFRPYVTDDIISTQVGGALKNVVALACGIADGRKMGDNARAALITRGLAEISRLARVKGGRQETLMGLSGIGDLMLTCSSMQSRNMSLGVALGQGEDLREAIPGRPHGLTEGVTTSESVHEMAMKLGISMPIATAVYYVLHEKLSVEEGIDMLLGRPLVNE